MALLGAVQDARETLLRKTDLPVEPVEAGIQAANLAVPKLRQGLAEVQMFLTQHPRPSEGDKADCIKTFLRYDDGEFFTRYVPVRLADDASSAEWHGLVGETKRSLESAIAVIETGVAKLGTEVAEARKSPPERRVAVAVLLRNRGARQTGVAKPAVLEILPNGGDRLYLESSSDLADLVLAPHSHRVVQFELCRGERNTTQAWDTALKRYASAVLNARVKILTLDMGTVSSSPFPFYSMDAYTEMCYRELAE